MEASIILYGNSPRIFDKINKYDERPWFSKNKIQKNIMVPVQLISSDRSRQSDLPSHLEVWLTQLPSKHSNSSDRHRAVSWETENKTKQKFHNGKRNV